MTKQIHYMDEKIELLKRHIAASPDASGLCKKFTIWLIDQTDHLNLSVRCIFHQPDINPEQGRQIFEGIQMMNSNTLQTRLDLAGQNIYDNTSCFFGSFSCYDTFTAQIRIGIDYKDAHSKKIDKYINIDMKEISYIDLDRYK